MDKKIRSLKPEEIEIRVAQITAKGAQLLLYKDSRCDKRILDETFGVSGWKNDYKEILGNLFCTISIWDEDKKQWVEKTDCGVESFSEKEKGQASDAFKRAGFNVGIGRELYTRIFYFINVPTKSTGKDGKGKEKYDLVDKFEKWNVSEIVTNEETEKIEKIKIVNSKNEVVFSYGFDKRTTLKTKQVEKPKEEPKVETKIEMITESQIKKIQTLFSKINVENFKENTYKKLKIKSSKELSKKSANELIDFLQKALDKKGEKIEVNE